MTSTERSYTMHRNDSPEIARLRSNADAASFCAGLRRTEVEKLAEVAPATRLDRARYELALAIAEAAEDQAAEARGKLIRALSSPPSEVPCRDCGDPIPADPNADRCDECVRVSLDGRECSECGADLVGNDPHEPGCSLDDSEPEPTVECRVYVDHAGYGRVASIEPGYLGWPPRYEIRLDEDSEKIHRSRDEFRVVADEETSSEARS